MPDVLNVRVEGEDEVIRAFEQAPRLAKTLLKRATDEASQLALDWLSVRPPQPSRTRAKSFNTWIREVGQANKTYFTEGAPRKIYRSSEKLLKRWDRKTVSERVGYVGLVENYASYAPQVQGTDQSPWHALTGWRTTTEAEETLSGRISRIFSDAVGALATVLKRLMV